MWGVSAPLRGCMDVNVFGCRKLEEELRRKLQREEARREQMRAQMLRDEDLLLQFENATNHLVVLLRGITVPGQVPVRCGGDHGSSRRLGVQRHSAVTLGAATVTPRGSSSPPRWLFSL